MSNSKGCLISLNLTVAHMTDDLNSMLDPWAGGVSLHFVSLS